ncbi:hypothetical protein IIB79_01860 [candidate division KSB1 bacterium]|nr:hypothetical protein [candidate division KSB1 bacterium]
MSFNISGRSVSVYFFADELSRDAGSILFSARNPCAFPHDVQPERW